MDYFTFVSSPLSPRQACEANGSGSWVSRIPTKRVQAMRSTRHFSFPVFGPTERGGNRAAAMTVGIGLLAHPVGAQLRYGAGRSPLSAVRQDVYAEGGTGPPEKAVLPR